MKLKNSAMGDKYITIKDSNDNVVGHISLDGKYIMIECENSIADEIVLKDFTLYIQGK